MILGKSQVFIKKKCILRAEILGELSFIIGAP